MRRVLVAVLAIVAALAASGCAPAERTPLYQEDFEDVCDGTPCGWVQVSGTPGGSIFVETLPGEHGVQLIGDGVAISGPAEGIEVIGGSIPAGDLRAHIVARCDDAALIEIIVSVRDVSGEAIDVVTSLTPAATWDGSRPAPVLVARDPPITPFGFTDILGVILRKNGPGVCEIDYFSLGSSSQPFVE